MTEEYWVNTYFSIARYCGRIKVNGVEYVICDKQGRDIFECSIIAEREGRDKAIEPGEPADLVDSRFLPVYRALGRERFIAWLDDGALDHSLDSAFALAGLNKPKHSKKTQTKTIKFYGNWKEIQTCR